MEETIAFLMKQDHGRISKLLDDVDKSIDQKKDVHHVLTQFSKALQEHFLIEEKVIFDKITKADGDCYTILMDLLKEHKTILLKLIELEEDVANKKDFDFNGFCTVLHKHKVFEDDKFYPMLDEDLDPEVQAEIVRRLKKRG